MTQSLEVIRTILARKHKKTEESFFRVNKECSIAAVGILPANIRKSLTPLLKIFVADKDEPRMILAQFSTSLGAKFLSSFLDFSLY